MTEAFDLAVGECIGYIAVFVAGYEVDDEAAAFDMCSSIVIGARRLRTKSTVVAEPNRRFECKNCRQNDNSYTNQLNG